MVFDNVTIIILGLVLVSVVSLVYGLTDVVLMVVSGLLGFLAKDRVVPSVAGSESVNTVVDVGGVVGEDGVQ